MNNQKETTSEKVGNLLSGIGLITGVIGGISLFLQNYSWGIPLLTLGAALLFLTIYAANVGWAGVLAKPFELLYWFPVATPAAIFVVCATVLVTLAVTKSMNSPFMWVFFLLGVISGVHMVVALLKKSQRGREEQYEIEEDDRTDYEILVDTKLPLLLLDYYSPASEFKTKNPLRSAFTTDYEYEVAVERAEEEREQRRFANADSHIEESVNGFEDEHYVEVELRVKQGSTVTKLLSNLETIKDGLKAFSVDALRDEKGGTVTLQINMEPVASDMDKLIASKPTTAMFADYPRDNMFRFPIGVNAKGEVVYLDLSHTLIAGVSRAGKGSPIQRVLEYYAPLVKTGEVRLWGVDPKNAEFKAFRNSSLFYRLAIDADDIGDLLDDFHSEMKRKQGLSGRDGVVTPETPIDILIVDEIVAVVNNKNVMNSEGSSGKTRQLVWDEILTQGASDYSFLIAATQIVLAKVLGDARVNFINRIALRLTSANHVDIVLGEGAVSEDGAVAHKIPRATKGNGYFSSGIANLFDDDGLQLIRFAYTSDEDIQKLIDAFPPLEDAPFEDEGEDRTAEIDAFLSTFDED